MADSARLTIDLAALASNYVLFCARASAEVAGIVNADAYGVGLAPVFERLKKEGCKKFFVATPDEALQIRRIDSGISVFVLGGLFHGSEAEYLSQNIQPVLNSPGDIERWKNLARQKEKKLPATIHFDTGMNRLGLGDDETRALLEDSSMLEGLDVRLVMSHFACADEKDHPLNGQQAARFAEIARHFPKAQKSLSNSSGLFRNESWHYDLLRPGYALYGGNPTPETNNPVRPVVRLEARVLQTRNVRKGESVGYSATHVFEKDTMTATLALGYADGFLRSASGKAQLYWKGKACPVLGRVSMDLVSIEIGHLDIKPQPGDWIEILGPHQTVDDLAARAGTIGYEILTSLGPRYKRDYTG